MVHKSSCHQCCIGGDAGDSVAAVLLAAGKTLDQLPAVLQEAARKGSVSSVFPARAQHGAIHLTQLGVWCIRPANSVQRHDLAVGP